MSKHVHPTSDMYGAFYDVVYPRKANEGLKYDFVFTKNKSWVYSCSENDPEKLIKSLAPVVEERNEKWRVVETCTGEIYKQNKTQKRRKSKTE